MGDSILLVPSDDLANEDSVETNRSCSVIPPPVQQAGTRWYIASLIITNAALGAGLLNFPFAFNQAGGIVAAMTVQVILLLFGGTSLLVLGWCADINGSKTYQDAIGALCGKYGRWACAVCIMVYMYAATVTYLVTVGDQTDRSRFRLQIYDFQRVWSIFLGKFFNIVFHDQIGDDFCYKWYLNRRFIIPLVSVLFIWPWCYSRKIDFLKFISTFATVGAFYLIFLTVFVYFTRDTSDIHTKTSPDDWSDIFLVIPAICFGYQCHVSVIPIYACISPHNINQFAYSVFVALFICFVAYSLVGIFGYLTFGTAVEADLLSCYSTNNVAVAVGYVMYALKTLLTVPILIFCGRVALETLLIEVGGLDPLSAERSERKRRLIISTVWFVSSVTVAVLVPSISFVIDFLGCLAAIFIFIFPGLCVLQALNKFNERWTVKQKYFLIGLAILYAVFGAFLFGLTFTQGVFQDTESRSVVHVSRESAKKMNEHCLT